MDIDDFIKSDTELSRLQCRYDKAQSVTADLERKNSELQTRLKSARGKERYAKTELHAALFRKSMESGLLPFGETPSPSDDAAPPDSKRPSEPLNPDTGAISISQA